MASIPVQAFSRVPSRLSGKRAAVFLFFISALTNRAIFPQATMPPTGAVDVVRFPSRSDRVRYFPMPLVHLRLGASEAKVYAPEQK